MQFTGNEIAIAVLIIAAFGVVTMWLSRRNRGTPTPGAKPPVNKRWGEGKVDTHDRK